MRRVDHISALSISIMVALLCAVSIPQNARADWKIYFSGQAQQMFGSAGRGSFTTRAQCEAYRASSAPAERNNSRCDGFDAYRSPKPAAQGERSPDSSAAAKESTNVEAEQAAREAAQRDQFQLGRQQLLQDLKGGGAAPSGGLALKPARAAGGKARQQLDCVARQSGDPRGGDWENRSDCTTVTPAVPEPTAPARALGKDDAIPNDMPALRQYLSALSTSIAVARRALSNQDAEISARTSDVTREAQQGRAKAGDKPAAESDALRRAREALAKAKSDREKTAAELQQLERREAGAQTRERELQRDVGNLNER